MPISIWFTQVCIWHQQVRAALDEGFIWHKNCHLYLGRSNRKELLKKKKCKVEEFAKIASVNHGMLRATKSKGLQTNHTKPFRQTAQRVERKTDYQEAWSSISIWSFSIIGKPPASYGSPRDNEAGWPKAKSKCQGFCTS